MWATFTGSHLTREPTAIPVLTKWWNWELILATNFGNLCTNVTKVGSPNFGYRIWFCTRLFRRWASYLNQSWLGFRMPYTVRWHNKAVNFLQNSSERHSIAHVSCWNVHRKFVAKLMFSQKPNRLIIMVSLNVYITIDGLTNLNIYKKVQISLVEKQVSKLKMAFEGHGQSISKLIGILTVLRCNFLSKFGNPNCNWSQMITWTSSK